MPCKCGSVYIVNKKYELCEKCNFIRLHGKTRLQATVEKLIETKPKEKKKPNKGTHLLHRERQVKRQSVLDRDKATYLEVFNNNPHVCAECGAPLPEEFLDENGNINCIGQYSHILSKGAYPEFRHNWKNFNRLCPVPCHDRWEFGDRESMNIFASNQVIIQQLYNVCTPTVRS